MEWREEAEVVTTASSHQRWAQWFHRVFELTSYLDVFVGGGMAQQLRWAYERAPCTHSMLYSLF